MQSGAIDCNGEEDEHEREDRKGREGGSRIAERHGPERPDRDALARMWMRSARDAAVQGRTALPRELK
jgi:hypothetical protein